MLKTAILLGIGFYIGKAVLGLAIAAVLGIVMIVLKIILSIFDR
jgi:hypothetical protein